MPYSCTSPLETLSDDPPSISHRSKSPVNSMRGVMDYLEQPSPRINQGSCMKQIYQLKQQLYQQQQLVIQKDLELAKTLQNNNGLLSKLTRYKTKAKHYKKQAENNKQAQYQLNNYKQDNQALSQQVDDMRTDIQLLQNQIQDNKQYYSLEMDEVKQKQRDKNNKIIKELQDMDNAKQEIQKNYINNKEKLKYYEILVHELKDKLQQQEMDRHRLETLLQKQDKEIIELKQKQREQQREQEREECSRRHSFIEPARNTVPPTRNTLIPTRRTSLIENKENRPSINMGHDKFEQKIQEIQAKITRRGEKLKRQRVGLGTQYEQYQYKGLIQDLKDMRHELGHTTRR